MGRCKGGRATADDDEVERIFPPCHFFLLASKASQESAWITLGSSNRTVARNADCMKKRLLLGLAPP